ncbi:MAG: HAD family hydrolase [Candidatus Merdivicinus sp.]|jgi:putative hydrolase of the HAD superfamily
MNKYRAIFFDRDGTLTQNDPEWENLRIRCLTEWSGKPFADSEDFFMRNFQKVIQGGFQFAPYQTVEEELLFFRQWFLFAFQELGITEKTTERADFLTEHLWYLKKQPFPETEEVLQYFQSHGYKMGVISDCPPSLEMTLKTCGLHRYFSSFTASSLTGAGKPSSIIFNAALRAQGVTAKESIFVDDTKSEADGAREQGFSSFWLDRTEKNNGIFIIHNLLDLISYVEEISP